MMKNRIYVIILALALTLLSSCGGRLRVKDLSDNSEQYRNQEVTLSGKVVDTFALPLVEKGVFKLDDGTGEMWVRPVGKVPAQGEDVEITGTLKIGLTIADKNFGLILVEKGAEE